MTPSKHYLEQNPKSIPSDKWSGGFKEVLFSSSKLVMMYTERVWHPPTDVYETPDEIVIKSEIGGINPDEDITIIVEEGKIIIQGKRSERDKRCKKMFKQMEINYGNLERVIHIHDHIVTEKAHASYKDGFLEIVIPKIEHADSLSKIKKIKINR